MPASRTNPANTTEHTSPRDIEAVPKPKRTAIRATRSQLAELTQLFVETPRPTLEARNALAVRTGLTTAWVAGWFMRERKKAPLEPPKNISGNKLWASRPQPLVSESFIATTAQTNRVFSSSLFASNQFERVTPTDWSATPSASSSFASSPVSSATPAPPPLKLSISTAHLVNRDSAQHHLRFLQSTHALQNMQNPNTSSVSTSPIVPITAFTERQLPSPTTYFHTPPPRPQPPRPCYRTRFSAPRRLTGETPDTEKVETGSGSVIVESNTAGAQDSETEEGATPYLGATDPAHVPPPSYTVLRET